MAKQVISVINPRTGDLENHVVEIKKLKAWDPRDMGEAELARIQKEIRTSKKGYAGTTAKKDMV